MSDLLAALLQRLETRLPPERIERVWLFSPRRRGERESGLVVFALYPAGDDPAAEQRRLLTLRYEVTREARGFRRLEELIEEGSAPTGRIERLMAGVLHRLGDESQAARAHWIGGDPLRWSRLLAELAARAVDPASGE